MTGKFQLKNVELATQCPNRGPLIAEDFISTPSLLSIEPWKFGITLLQLTLTAKELVI